MDRLSPQDASFLHVENDQSHMHIASVAIFEGPAPSYRELSEMVQSKLHRVPRYRQRVRFVPFEMGRPVWADDPHFKLEYHLRHTGLPAPGGEEQLRNLVGRVMSQPLDRARPLWEMWVAEGLEDGRWAVLSKTHHCMVDGVSGTDLLTVVMDDAPDAEHASPEPWQPEAEPSGAALLARALAERATSPYEAFRSARSALRGPRRAADRLRELGSGLGSLGRLARSGAETSLNGPIGPHRRWGWASTTLDAVKRIRAAHGGTVNAVVLATITKGFRELLLGRDEPVKDRVVRTLVPVSLRRPEDRGVFDNRVSAMFAELPVGIEDPVKRLHAIRAQLQELKESKQAVAAEALTSLSGFAPPLLLALGTRIFSRLPQRMVQTVTTNVPGPQRPLYACGRRMLVAYPFVPLAGWVRIGVAIFSYAGQVNFGVTGDYDTCGDLPLLCHGIEEGVEELLKAS